MTATSAPWYHGAVALYDRGYRFLHGLDRPEAQAGPLLSVERRCMARVLRLADGTLLRQGDRVGVLHVNNARALALHTDGLGPAAVGFEFRRLFMASLRALAARAADGGPWASLTAYSISMNWSTRSKINVRSAGAEDVTVTNRQNGHATPARECR